MFNKKWFWLVGALIFAALALAACAPGGSPVVQTASKDYVAEMLQHRELGDNVGGFVLWTVLALVGLVFVGGYMLFRNEDRRAPILNAIVPAILVATMVFGFGAVRASYVAIDAGDTGVLLEQGAVVNTLNPGQHWIKPWFQKVVLFSTRTFTFTTLSDPINKGSEQYRTYDMSVTSSDVVQGVVNIQIQAHIDPTKAKMVYAKFGTAENAIVQTLKTPSLQFVRDALRGKTAEQIVTQIESLNPVVEKQLVESASPNGIIVESFAFRKPSFGEWEKMRNDTAVSAQAAEKAKNDALVVKEQQQARLYEADTNSKINQVNAEAQAKASITKANADAEIAKTQAQGAAEAAKIQADAAAYTTTTKAAAEAKGNKEVAGSVTPNLIEYLKWQRWDGKWPQIVSDLAGLFVQAPTPAK